MTTVKRWSSSLAGSRPRWHPSRASPTCRRSCSEAIALALTGVEVDYLMLEPLGTRRAGRRPGSARPSVPAADRPSHGAGRARAAAAPDVVAHRVAKYAEALGVKDDFVRVARRYAQGAYGLAWMDLQRNGFVDHVRDAGDDEPRGKVEPAPDAPPRHFEPAAARPRAGRAVACLRGPPGRDARTVASGRCTTAAASRCPGTPGWRTGVPRAARLRARSRRLRHQPQG